MSVRADSPDQVDIKNPLWHSGMDTLSEVIAGRLGYKGVPLQCKLYKLLVYGEGGQFVKHQDTEKEDGMVATLVVQLPSLHEGGDLVVYRGGKEVQRHDFGKKDGTAAYLPQYAVHYADAEHGLEKVTKGYRLVLVYSICLPPAMRHLMKSSDDSLGEELGSFISGMEADENSFALLLAHEYTEKSIEEFGSGSFKGIDRTRFQTLEEANRFAAPDKKLQLFIAQLKHDIDYWDDGGSWEENRRDESITWYSPSGEKLGDYPESNFQLNLLNPVHGVKNAFEFINVNAAARALQAQKLVGSANIRNFLDDVNSKLEETQHSYSRSQSNTISISFCKILCELLVEAGDPAPVNLFFHKFLGRLPSNHY
uniref:Fe2OG dioxygenase domain-containing protein n=1 Tax=Phytophthora ramorum TaxID=164328 RepID=H3GL27_PHYRM